MLHRPLAAVLTNKFLVDHGLFAGRGVLLKAHRSNGSEANAVIDAFDDLRVADKQAILDFLRSL